MQRNSRASFGSGVFLYYAALFVSLQIDDLVKIVLVQRLSYGLTTPLEGAASTQCPTTQRRQFPRSQKLRLSSTSACES